MSASARVRSAPWLIGVPNTTKPHTGTGWDLWLARSLAHKHGGSIRSALQECPFALRQRILDFLALRNFVETNRRLHLFQKVPMEEPPGHFLLGRAKSILLGKSIYRGHSSIFNISLLTSYLGLNNRVDLDGRTSTSNIILRSAVGAPVCVIQLWIPY